MRGWTSAFVVAAVTLGASFGPATHDAEADGASVWFRVTQTDGTIVRNPVVVVSVFGPTYPFTHVLTGGPTGEVVVSPPAGDPVAADRLRRGEPVNLMIRVFDKAPGSADINSAYVAASIGVDATGVRRELSSVTGKTFTLQPGRTAFSPVDPATAALLDTRSVNPTAATDAPECAQGDGTPRLCQIVDYPDWSRQTMVSVADNHGAGADVVSELRYNSTIVTTTEVAFQAGKTGFVQAGGGVSYEKQRTAGFGFGSSGPHNNVRALLESVFMRERSGACYSEGGQGGTWVCQMETTYRPYEATGTYSMSYSMYHDNMNTEFDCWTNNDGYYEPVTQSSAKTWFQFRLGPSEDWAQTSQGGLYANTTITQQTYTKTGHVRKWAVVGNPTHRHQYMYYPGGKLAYDPSQAEFAACVRAHLGEVLTHSSDINYNDPVLHAPDDIPAPSKPDPPNEGEAPRTVCGRMPDKCD